jgi:hypothetical protein
MLDDHKELMERENNLRKQELQKRQNSLKVHRIQIEDKKDMTRRTVHLAGFDLEKDLQDWKVAGTLQYGKRMKDFQIMEMESEHLTIQFISPDVFILGKTEGLLEEGKLSLPNFGSFRIREAKARIARNPRTGEKVELSDRKVVRFKPAGKLKALLSK